ncbi:MAG: hypothetical protein N0E48_04045, partial [Candidatus Thiodiazotropha endolucinida]|nr:hypothetical protein [Candidatus Thiodiazotropha taylori]MCW4342523.1 hypothetical protein [Candidatus Thiodiazotropha endolucinida]
MYIVLTCTYYPEIFYLYSLGRVIVLPPPTHRTKYIPVWIPVLITEEEEEEEEYPRRMFLLGDEEDYP